MPRGGKGAKAKGSTFEREFAKTVDGRRTPLSGSAGGGDVIPGRTNLWRAFSWELKRRNRLPKLVTDGLDQAANDIPILDDRRPAVAMRGDYGRVIVAFYWDDLREFVEYVAANGISKGQSGEKPVS